MRWKKWLRFLLEGSNVISSGTPRKIRRIFGGFVSQRVVQIFAYGAVLGGSEFMGGSGASSVPLVSLAGAAAE